MIPWGTALRIARPTDNLEAIKTQYCRGLHFEILGQFQDHEGFDGYILGLPGEQYHLEFTHQRGTRVGRAPTRDHLLVFYMEDFRRMDETPQEMRDAGFKEVPPLNPYWQRVGYTFEDLDGYRVVIADICGRWYDDGDDPPPWTRQYGDRWKPEV